MPLLDYGHIDLDFSGNEPYIKPFDIIPFCKNGAITNSIKCNYKLLKNKIIPEILTAINILHSNKLVHRDIKPGNIYMYDDVILLADFGTTSDIINKTACGYTLTRRQTPGYSAPEISENYYVVASDYYSFGCTIAALYNKEEHVYQELLNKRKEFDVRIEIKRIGLPLKCPTHESDLQLLVDSLTIGDEKTRAGYDDVKIWLYGRPDIFFLKWKDRLDFTRAYK